MAEDSVGLAFGICTDVDHDDIIMNLNDQEE